MQRHGIGGRSAAGVLAVTLAATCAVACASPGGPGVAVVEVTDAGFEPATLVVAPGTEVRWTNVSAQAHAISSGGDLLPDQQAIPEGAEPFDSGRLREGEAFAHVVELEGEYYYEGRHQDGDPLVGTIQVVQP
ncbi:hypothetical protein [Nesterenkonia lutea]|uniref:Plastocyanin n=1 Tax=Nesterenkonia lutea TaxID=272919 RepID=A0ABR9JBY6_9MICC|nr:hypothetical protein [Nesterenkonia lutea]MBE1523447.1 plastocyanin [Nesterenkonia lutea]